jgi:hypothetical protein
LVLGSWSCSAITGAVSSSRIIDTIAQDLFIGRSLVGVHSRQLRRRHRIRELVRKFPVESTRASQGGSNRIILVRSLDRCDFSIAFCVMNLSSMPAYRNFTMRLLRFSARWLLFTNGTRAGLIPTVFQIRIQSIKVTLRRSARSDEIQFS